MRRRTLTSLLIVLAFLAALGVALYLRSKAPPEAARLLPESDAIVYVHLKTLRPVLHFDTASEVRSPGLQHFIDATGIVPERDLDAVAMGLHRVATPLPHQPHAPVAEIFTSEVLVGRFDGQRLTHYLDSIATARESYADRTIYTIPLDDQSLRIAQLGYDTIGASNMPTSEQIHSMIDRSRASALSSPGSSLLAARYSEVPQLPFPPVAWGIGHIGLPFSQNGYVTVMGLQFPIPEDTDLVASLRYAGSAHLRVEEIAPDEDSAKHTAETVTTLLNILRNIGSEQARFASTSDPSAAAMRNILGSATIEQHGDRAILDASANGDQIKAIASAAHPAAPDATPVPASSSNH